jgi:diacylglycerol kinase family enzyme
VRALRFLINPTSGGGQGVRLGQELTACAGADRVYPLDALPAALAAAADEGGALVAAGGDGTASAALAASLRRGGQVPVAVLPLGTGNDLARVCGWPLRLDDLAARCAALANAVEAPIDGWRVAADDGHGADGDDMMFFLYCSLGADARIARRFHGLRQRRRWLLRSPRINQAAYALLGLGETHRPLPLRGLTSSDGAPPATASALLLANVPSYAGGRQVAAGIVAGDGGLDAIALPPGLSLGLVLGGLRRLRRIGRSAAWSFQLDRPLSCQLDGEPRLLPAGRHRITHAGQARVLIAR